MDLNSFPPLFQSGSLILICRFFPSFKAHPCVVIPPWNLLWFTNLLFVLRSQRATCSPFFTGRVFGLLLRQEKEEKRKDERETKPLVYTAVHRLLVFQPLLCLLPNERISFFNYSISGFATKASHSPNWSQESVPQYWNHSEKSCWGSDLGCEIAIGCLPPVMGIRVGPRSMSET